MLFVGNRKPQALSFFIADSVQQYVLYNVGLSVSCDLVLKCDSIEFADKGRKKNSNSQEKTRKNGVSPIFG